MNKVKEIVNNLRPFPEPTYDPLNEYIYSSFDIQHISRFLLLHWKKFIDVDNMRCTKPLINLYAVCLTTNINIVNNVVNTLYQALHEFFDEYDDTYTEEDLNKFLDLKIEMNMQTLVYRKTKTNRNYF